MKNLLKKEILLTMHPTAILFLFLSALLIVPNYPYYVTFFYTGLAIFFTCLNGRENNDVFYTMILPVAKKAIVKARFTLVIIIELLQMLIAIPFAIIRQNMGLPGNAVGMDANIAFFGLSFILLGIFNVVFFGIYYKDVKKVGKPFAVSSVITFIFICIAEVCAHAVPFVRDRLDTSDNMYVTEKLIVLIAGFAIYVILTAFIYKKSLKNFEVYDI